MKKSILTLALAAGMTLTSLADAPVTLKTFTPNEDGEIEMMSDNGKWAVGITFDDDAKYTKPFLMNLTTGELTNLYKPSQVSTEARCHDITDDGKYAAGGFAGYAAIYDVANNKWIYMPVPEGFTYQEGRVSAITADGKYAVGYFYVGVEIQGTEILGYKEVPMAWDLTEGVTNAKVMTLDHVPAFDTRNDNADSVRFLDISPDGQNIFCLVNFTAPMTAWSFIYNIPTQTWKPLGLKYESGQLIQNSSMEYAESGRFSRNGKYLGLSAFNGEDAFVAIYDVESGQLREIPESTGKIFGDIDDFGVPYASTPSSMPVRDFGFYTGGYWFDFKTAIKQLYGIDWKKDMVKSDDDNSGTLRGITADGLHIMSVAYERRPNKTMVIDLNKPFAELSMELDPLANNNVYPLDGSVFSTLREMTIQFDREIEVIGDRTSVKVYDEDGNAVYTALSVALKAGDPQTLAVVFRNATLAKDKKYKVVIPAGTVQIAGDAARKNTEISVQYVGRENAPVKMTRVNPEPGTALSRLSMTTNPINILFDCMIEPLDGKISLYRLNDAGEEEFVTQLSGSTSGNMLSVYPLGDIDLAKDVTYKVTVGAGVVGDLSGSNGNEEFSFTYKGLYEPVQEWASGVIYQEDFNYGLGNMLLYDGDQLDPNSTMLDWGFTYEYPWWYARDNEETLEQSAVSHSMYVPAGKSDDWMITERLYIPDAKCKLYFQSQSYLNGKQDYLKVYIYATDAVYTAPISKSVVDKFKAEAKLVYNELQSPGAKEEMLEGDWRNNTIDLAEYAGKHIYIAFVNDNEDQSAVFIDNVLVERDMAFTLSFDVPAHVVAAESVPVKGTVKINDSETHTALTFRLLDADGNKVDELNATGLNLTKGDTYDFAFNKELPLKPNVNNIYTVEIVDGDVVTPINAEIINLAFAPNRTVVVEENTGTGCQFCPLGYRAFEIIEESYGDKVIPIAIHGYRSNGGTGSEFGNTWSQTYSDFLGLNSAPIAAINRQEAGGPFYSGDGVYSLHDPENGSTWFDIINKQLSELTSAEIAIDHAWYDPETRKIEVGTNMRYAYDNANVNLNLHTVVLEGNLNGTQQSGIYATTSDLLGDWGNGGKYGRPNVRYTFNHVARGMHGYNYNGVNGFYPKTLVAGNNYPATYSFAAPDYLENHENGSVVVMLIDANTGVVLNAAHMSLAAHEVGVESVAAQATKGNVYTTTGICVLKNATMADTRNLQPGIYIFNGKKILVK